MEKYLSVLKRSRLFAGITESEITAMLQCLSAAVRIYDKGDCVLRRGETVSSVAMLLEGSIHIQKEDYWGNLSILSEIAPGEIFGEVYACLGNEEMLNSAVAVQTSRVLFLDMKRVITMCPSACRFPWEVNSEPAVSHGLEKQDAGRKAGAYGPPYHAGKIAVLSVRAVIKSRLPVFLHSL